MERDFSTGEAAGAPDLERGRGLTVLHVIECFLTGPMYAVRNLTGALAPALGRQVVLHGLRPDTPPDYAALFDPGIELVRRSAVRDISPPRDLGAVREYRALLTRLRPDLVHFEHGSWLEPNPVKMEIIGRKYAIG